MMSMTMLTAADGMQEPSRKSFVSLL